MVHLEMILWDGCTFAVWCHIIVRSCEGCQRAFISADWGTQTVLTLQYCLTGIYKRPHLP